LYKQEIFGIF